MGNEQNAGTAVASTGLFCRRPLSDGQDWECQCARCGSSVTEEVCSWCGGDGETQPGELYEEDPLWYDEDDTEPCHQCGGEGGWARCISAPEWCDTHPMPGRERVESGEVEWFPIGRQNHVSGTPVP